MTEATWLLGSDYTSLREYLGARMTDRKELLFGCGDARRRWHLLKQEANRDAVRTSERFADGLVTDQLMLAAWRALEWEPAAFFEWPIGPISAGVGYRRPTEEESGLMYRLPYPEKRTPEVRLRDWSDVLRELFGNPFRPATFDPSWLRWHDGTITELARSIYDEYTFDHMPVLADALEDAGCTAPTILDHCRGPNGHVRGCWVIDLLLGKE